MKKEENARCAGDYCKGCFGYSELFGDGYCTVLIDTDFGGRYCPFYKPKKEHFAAVAESLSALVRTGSQVNVSRAESLMREIQKRENGQ